MPFHLHKTMWERRTCSGIVNCVFGLFSIWSIDSTLTRLYWKRTSSGLFFFKTFLPLTTSCAFLVVQRRDMVDLTWVFFSFTSLPLHIVSASHLQTPVHITVRFLHLHFCVFISISVPVRSLLSFLPFSTLLSEQYGLEWQGCKQSIYINDSLWKLSTLTHKTTV